MNEHLHPIFRDILNKSVWPFPPLNQAPVTGADAAIAKDDAKQARAEQRDVLAQLPEAPL